MKALVSKFGTLSRAWRLGLDVDGSGKMDMREFCEALRRLGYVGNIRTLWHLLEGGNSGTISFDELDRKAAAALEKFRVMSLMNHKSIEHMWKVVMDKDRSNHVGLPLFLEGCKALGYEDEEEVKELFEHLLLRGGSRNLSVEDLRAEPSRPKCPDVAHQAKVEGLSCSACHEFHLATASCGGIPVHICVVV